ncbi:hypothetical protein [Nocardia caishijiensis]|uniref:Uncharacterized protein n=1 Tax=Nocardia caishijiensis TaxID=184756 RepID=A0ABQ6YKQ6_9NOCA|nr:hypothetical protein [Nocardia caishijiensis]KAF0846374.1 hypothetical protein FNL39_105285 [Nocardia caishijiensis]
MSTTGTAGHIRHARATGHRSATPAVAYGTETTDYGVAGLLAAYRRMTEEAREDRR